LSLPAVAGSRDGFFVLVVDLDAGRSLISKNLVDGYFNGGFPESLYSCADGGNFELVYLRKRPRAINEGMISLALAGDKKSLSRVRSVLGGYKDREIKDGFDFLVSYRLVDGVVELTAISSAEGVAPVQRQVNVGRNAGFFGAQKNFSDAICELSSRMPYAVAP
jgi:hypothetical protein